jgi:ubiquinone/menaquinone biosynthesis C-methylase UbiE
MFANPEQNIAKLGLREGMKVADLGAGTGAYAKAASYHVGHTGHVYAIEVQKELVKKLDSELAHSGIKNTECIWADIEHQKGTKLADQSMDAVIVSNVLFQVEDKLGLIDEAKRILKRNAKLMLIDWAESFGGMGPDLNHVLPKGRAIDLFTKRGFKIVESISAGSHQYGILFTYE